MADTKLCLGEKAEQTERRTVNMDRKRFSVGWLVGQSSNAGISDYSRPTVTLALRIAAWMPLADYFEYIVDD